MLLSQILACPRTQKKLVKMNEKKLKSINEKISRGEIKNKAGRVISEFMEAGLMAEDEMIVYRIQNDIPVLLVEESIEL